MNRGIHEECDHLVQLAKDKLKKSMVADIESGKSVESKVRISSSMFLNKAQSHKRAAHWKNRSFPHCDMLCIIFEKDRATGKDTVTADDVLEEVSRNESIDTQDLSVEEIDTLSNASIKDEGNSNKGKKRNNSSDSSDAFHEAAMIIGTKIEEATDKFSRALGVDLDIALKRDKINEELCKLSNL